MEDWKVQCSVKKGDVMWNFRGDTVYEVQKMKDEVFASAKAAPVPEPEAPAETPEAVAPAAAPDHELTPVEKARLKMQQGGK
jgi:hypothetical protein